MHIFWFFFFLKDTLIIEDFKSILLHLVKYQNTQQLQVQERMEEKWQKQLLSQQEKIEKILEQTQKENQERQLEFQKQVFELISCSNSIENEFSFLQNAIWCVIENFSYSPEEDVTFASYFRRYEDLYTTDHVKWSDSKKVHLLLRKLGTSEHTKFINYILPRKASELTFAEAVELLMKLFSPKTSLIHERWTCLNLTRKEGEDYTAFASEVNKHCNDFRLAELSVDNFKCLILRKG